MTPEIAQLFDDLLAGQKERERKALMKSRPNEYDADRSSVGVWMSVRSPAYSVSRLIALDVMRTLDIDPADFRTRDKIINGISDRVNGTLDAVDLQP